MKRVKYVVFDAETFDIWKEWHNRLIFKQDSMGFTFQYAEFSKKRPCWATLWFYEIEGVFTAFVDAHGAYVDYHALEETVWELVGMKPGRNNTSDGMNFHHHVAWDTMTPELRHERLVKDAEYRLAEATRDLVRYAQDNSLPQTQR